MASSNPLISREGFRYLFEQITEPKNSTRILAQLVDSLYDPLVRVQPQIREHGSYDLRKVKKDLQYKGITELLGTLGVKDKRGLVEFCCGNGELSFYLARQLDIDVLGVDINPDLIEKNRVKNTQPHLGFIVRDLYADKPRINGNVFLALHSCGRLLDRILDLASATRTNTEVVVVPCCYGKINNEQKILPRSQELKSQRELFLQAVKKAARFEGLVGNHPGTRGDLMLETFRRLVDFDRVFYLQEQGYETSFVRISPRSLALETREYGLSPANVAIIGQR